MKKTLEMGVNYVDFNVIEEQEVLESETVYMPLVKRILEKHELLLFKLITQDTGMKKYLRCAKNSFYNILRLYNKNIDHIDPYVKLIIVRKRVSYLYDNPEMLPKEFMKRKFYVSNESLGYFYPVDKDKKWIKPWKRAYDVFEGIDDYVKQKLRLTKRTTFNETHEEEIGQLEVKKANKVFNKKIVINGKKMTLNDPEPIKEPEPEVSLETEPVLETQPTLVTEPDNYSPHVEKSETTEVTYLDKPVEKSIKKEKPKVMKIESPKPVKTVAQPIVKPIAKPIAKPVEKPKPKPVEKQKPKPIEKPAEKPKPKPIEIDIPKPKPKIETPINRPAFKISGGSISSFCSSGLKTAKAGGGGGGGESCMVCDNAPFMPKNCNNCGKIICAFCLYDLEIPDTCPQCKIGSFFKSVKQDPNAMTENIFNHTGPKSDLDKYEKVEPKNKRNSLNNISNSKLNLFNQSINGNETKADNTPEVNKFAHLKNLKLGMNAEKVIVTDDEVWSFLHLVEYSNGNTIISGHILGEINLWSIEKGVKLKSYKEHTSIVYDLKPAIGYTGKDGQDNKMFLSSAKDNTVKLWNVEKANSLKTIVNESAVLCIDMINYSDKLYLITGDKKAFVNLWNMNKDNEVVMKSVNNQPQEIAASIATGHSKEICKILPIRQIKPYNLIITASNPDMRLIDLKESKAVRVFKGHTGMVNNVTYLRKRRFVSSSNDSTIKIWTLDDENCLKTINMHSDKVYSILYLNSFLEQNNISSDVLITGGADKKLNIIDIQEKRIVTNQGETEVLEEALVSSYDKKDTIYKLMYLPANDKFKIASIDYGCSNNIYFWGEGK